MKNKVLLFLLIIILTYSLGGICYVKIMGGKNKNESVINLETINNFDYSLKSNATDLYKEEFNILKANLTSNEINNDEYMKSVSKLFIIDLYTLENKINKYDVGGVEFVYPNSLDNYKLNVQNTLYKYIEDNSNKKRNKDLPVVKYISVENVENAKYKMNETEVDAYNVNLKWEYVNENDYNKEAIVTLINEESKYYIVEVK